MPDSLKRPSSSLALAARGWRDYLGRYWPLLLVSVAAMAVYAASASAIPAGVEWINRSLAGETSPLPASKVAVLGPLLIIVLAAANAIAQYVQVRSSASAALSALRDMQADFHQSLTRIDDAQLRALGSGDAVARLTSDPLVLRETLTRASSALRDLLTLAGLCAVMIWYDWVLFLVVAVVYPLIGWPVIRIGKFLRQRSREAQGQASEIASLAGETVAGGRIIRAYRLEDAANDRARAAFDRRLNVLKRMAHMRALNEPFIFFVGAVALALIVAIVALRIEAGALAISEFVGFIIALLLMSQPARGLSTLNAVMQEGLAAFERLIEVIDLEPRIADKAGATPLAVTNGAVSFRNLSFSYGGGAALDGFTLDAPGGARVALVGPSGAGKSTVFNLLLRLYEPAAGDINIDGQPIASSTLASLRDNIAVVSQEALLFDDTIAANIALGRKGASDAEIVAAAKNAAAHEFIAALPGGYDTRVGEAGGNLSGGERQRIAIARAFLKDAPILLLDEATSALDAASEAQVQAALARLSEGRTTLVIAHRLSTVRDADLIVVMKAGRVVETGRHDELSARGGLYAELAALQFVS